MSWQGYVDEQLIAAGMVQALICGLDGVVWAVSGIQASPDETKRIVEQFNDPSSVFATGIVLGGTKYMGIKGDEGSLYGKKGAGGIVCVKTGQTVIVGVYDQHLQPGNAAVIVEKLGDYLKDNGY